MKLCFVAVVAGLVLTTAPGMAGAQDTTATPNYGEITLTHGFSDDPYHVDVTAGGTIQASTLGGSCTGKISSAPDFRVRYTAGSLPLIFRTNSTSDTTLIVNGADGHWYCDDDSLGQMNAQVTFASPQSGTYDVWVGSYGGDYESATLLVSELENSTYTPTPAPAPAPTPAPAPAQAYTPPTPQPDSSLKATYGEITLSSGFTPDPRRIPLRAGGNINAADVSSDCKGSIARAPDYRIDYHAGRQPLIVRTESPNDTTLVINDADGHWQCNDDGGTAAGNAEVMFDKPDSGTYDIWVGTYGGGTGAATLVLTERP